ncbi:hypothetical protein LX15_002267 [Streptoalloteichus tenebrarius]|uniref:Uncharacterized protein n=1 Tax=Streptoalloteichus tenebrarius (strain ATCC 17920 / DSM 40477 / JCM 4838 / CBS 697.72 / NBRC 16177 / NCIMB 11028 / NRRL B-12390 / A12253. 1 / ISP 5477) TaxID=1933 RepID=A0ABT1HSQ6_STRSD|nr:hypothetical protein [Streptoalloteichus tenebrarius]MCP2258569.1 hypothetical protein [Streptoalloteichus tenebrarius]BFF04062.1 hypothetical protein GCM10020241_57370 [Streptoalloteichus tenebrarius]
MNNVDEGLNALIQRGFRFQHLRDRQGAVSVIIGSYGWSEYYDCIHIHGERDAAAARAVMNSRPGADEVVWSYDGNALSAIRALLELPKPHEPGAPRLAKRAPSGLWLPGSGHDLVVPPGLFLAPSAYSSRG